MDEGYAPSATHHHPSGERTRFVRLQRSIRMVPRPINIFFFSQLAVPFAILQILVRHICSFCAHDGASAGRSGPSLLRHCLVPASGLSIASHSNYDAFRWCWRVGVARLLSSLHRRRVTSLCYTCSWDDPPSERMCTICTMKTLLSFDGYSNAARLFSIITRLRFDLCSKDDQIDLL